MALTPTARSLDLLRRDGWLVEVVERWIPGARLRRRNEEKNALDPNRVNCVKPLPGLHGPSLAEKNTDFPDAEPGAAPAPCADREPPVDELEARYPGAVVEPIEDKADALPPPNDAERRALTDYLTAIGETDPECIAAFWKQVETDAEARAAFLRERAPSKPAYTTEDLTEFDRLIGRLCDLRGYSPEKRAGLLDRRRHMAPAGIPSALSAMRDLVEMQEFDIPGNGSPAIRLPDGREIRVRSRPANPHHALENAGRDLRRALGKD